MYHYSDFGKKRAGNDVVYKYNIKINSLIDKDGKLSN